MLNSEKAKIIIQKLRLDYEQIKPVNIERLVKQSYDLQGAQPIVREVLRNCDFCSDQIIHRRFTDTFVHASRLKLDRIGIERKLSPKGLYWKTIDSRAPLR